MKTKLRRSRSEKIAKPIHRIGIANRHSEAEHRRLKELSPLNPISMMAFYGSKVSGRDDSHSMHTVISSMKSTKLETESPTILEFEKRRAMEDNLDSLTATPGKSTHA